MEFLRAWGPAGVEKERGAGWGLNRCAETTNPLIKETNLTVAEGMHQFIISRSFRTYGEGIECMKGTEGIARGRSPGGLTLDSDGRAPHPLQPAPRPPRCVQTRNPIVLFI